VDALGGVVRQAGEHVGEPGLWIDVVELLPFDSAFISADTVEASTAPVIRIRPPPTNSISITPAVAGEASGDATSGSGKTATGENARGDAGRHSSCRQRNNWLT
jgi:hypothetical protein